MEEDYGESRQSQIWWYYQSAESNFKETPSYVPLWQSSPTFLGWVFGFNGKVQILAPESVKEQYRQMIAQADEGMQQKENKEQEI